MLNVPYVVDANAVEANLAVAQAGLEEAQAGLAASEARLATTQAELAATQAEGERLSAQLSAEQRGLRDDQETLDGITRVHGASEKARKALEQAVQL